MYSHFTLGFPLGNNTQNSTPDRFAELWRFNFLNLWETSSLPAHWELVSREITCVTEDAFSACNGFRWSILSAGPWNPQGRQKPPIPLEPEPRNTPTPYRFTWQCDGLSCLFLLWAKLSRKKISPQPQSISAYIAMGWLFWIIVCMVSPASAAGVVNSAWYSEIITSEWSQNCN